MFQAYIRVLKEQREKGPEKSVEKHRNQRKSDKI